jgi:hypothetical protein
MSDDRLDHIGDLIDPALRRLGVRREVREVQLREHLEQVLGPALGPTCRALRLERGALLIATPNGATAQQLQLESPRIIAALNERLGADAVKRLRFAALSGDEPR